MIEAEKAWAVLQKQLAADDAAWARSRKKRRRREAVAGDEFPELPDLVFSFAEEPPRHTLQSGRGVQVRGGRPMFFTRKAAKQEAEAMVWKFRAGLPPGWRPRGGAVKLEVLLVYGARRADKLAGGMMAFHVERPDADNLVKSLLDSMTRAGVWEDDGQVSDLTVRKRRSALPRWEVKVWFARPAQGALEL